MSLPLSLTLLFLVFIEAIWTSIYNGKWQRVMFNSLVRDRVFILWPNTYSLFHIAFNLLLHFYIIKMSFYVFAIVNLKRHEKYTGCWDGLSYIDKLKMVYTFYKLLYLFFPLSYGFGMVYISLTYEVCAPRVSPLICRHM